MPNDTGRPEPGGPYRFGAESAVVAQITFE